MWRRGRGAAGCAGSARPPPRGHSPYGLLRFRSATGAAQPLTRHATKGGEHAASSQIRSVTSAGVFLLSSGCSLAMVCHAPAVGRGNGWRGRGLRDGRSQAGAHAAAPPRRRRSGRQAQKRCTMRSGFRPGRLAPPDWLLKRRKPLHTNGILGRFGPGTLYRKRSCRVPPAWTRRPRSTHLPARCLVSTA
jgi:hypothetical protein